MRTDIFNSLLSEISITKRIPKNVLLKKLAKHLKENYMSEVSVSRRAVLDDLKTKLLVQLHKEEKYRLSHRRLITKENSFLDSYETNLVKEVKNELKKSGLVEMTRHHTQLTEKGIIVARGIKGSSIT